MEEIILEKRFGDIGEDWSKFKKARVAIIQAPYEGKLSYMKGTSKGPEAIINASLKMELFDDELQVETYKIGIYTNPPLKFENDAPPEVVIKNLEEVTKDAIQSNKFPVILGGDHSLTLGAVKAAKNFYSDLSVLYLDAHYDLRDEYLGSRYNHACSARRIQEVCPVLAAGVRSLSKEEKDFLDTNPANVKAISVWDIIDTADWKKEATRLLSDTVYITIDLDVLDPSILGSTGTPEPGGLGWYEFLDFLKVIAKDKKIVGFDVVELSPKEGFVAPDFLAAKLIYRLLGYVFYIKR